MSQDFPCGYHSPALSVLCLDRNYELSRADQAELIRYTGGKFLMRATSNPAAIVAYSTLRPVKFDENLMQVEIGADPTCRGQCDRRLTLQALK